MYIYQIERELLNKQIKNASSYVSGAVLDVGAGNCDRYRHFFQYDKYVRMDIEKGENVDVVGSADNIPFSENGFDSIVCTQVFEHLKYPEKATKEMHRVLKNGGFVIITVPQTGALHEEPHDYWRFTKYGVMELFERNGFELVEYSQRGGFFVVIAQTFIRYMLDQFNLYERKFLGRISNCCFRILGVIAIKLDNFNDSEKNRRHAFGWCFVFKKLS
jgi:SAM-dependent methyltransferase